MYKTPGVYVQEVSTLPPSVAEVSTAIPAFIGCTATGTAPRRISTLLEYEEYFGGPSLFTFSATSTRDDDDNLELVEISTVEPTTMEPSFMLHYCMQLYFKNGGGPCYVFPAGNYAQAPQKSAFEAAIGQLAMEDEPTLIVLVDALSLGTADYTDLCGQVLAQCVNLQDRFALLDVPADDVEGFRNGIGMNGLAYGAAYLPYLDTTLNARYDDGAIAVQIADTASGESVYEIDFGADTIVVTFTGEAGANPGVRIYNGMPANEVSFVLSGEQLSVKNVNGKNGEAVTTAFTAWSATNESGGFNVVQSGNGSGPVAHTSQARIDLAERAPVSMTLVSIEQTQTALFNAIKRDLAGRKVRLPPSAAIAGVCARVDRQRGVWKAPANVSVASVTGPAERITDDEQADLNVDATAGKSINVIRAFMGKGTIVWGARTLAGNDNEWRYIPVRRLFNTVEESLKKSTGFAVFEPNDATTWARVKGMCDGYLTSLWERGALAGSTPASSFYVNVGLGKTMTSQDILEGRMIVEIGIAAVRPAEFIILRFSHKLQEA